MRDPEVGKDNVFRNVGNTVGYDVDESAGGILDVEFHLIVLVSADAAKLHLNFVAVDNVKSAAVAVSPEGAAVGGPVAEHKAADVAKGAVFQTDPHNAGLGEHRFLGPGWDPDAGVAGVKSVGVVLRHGQTLGLHNVALNLVKEIRLVFGLPNARRFALRQKIAGAITFKILLEENTGLRINISRGYSQRR